MIRSSLLKFWRWCGWLPSHLRHIYCDAWFQRKTLINQSIAGKWDGNYWKYLNTRVMPSFFSGTSWIISSCERLVNKWPFLWQISEHSHQLCCPRSLPQPDTPCAVSVAAAGRVWYNCTCFEHALRLPSLHFPSTWHVRGYAENERGGATVRTGHAFDQSGEFPHPACFPLSLVAPSHHL